MGRILLCLHGTGLSRQLWRLHPAPVCYHASPGRLPAGTVRIQSLSLEPADRTHAAERCPAADELFGGADRRRGRQAILHAGCGTGTTQHGPRAVAVVRQHSCHRRAALSYRIYLQGRTRNTDTAAFAGHHGTEECSAQPSESRQKPGCLAGYGRTDAPRTDCTLHPAADQRDRRRGRQPGCTAQSQLSFDGTQGTGSPPRRRTTQAQKGPECQY